MPDAKPNINEINNKLAHKKYNNNRYRNMRVKYWKIWYQEHHIK